MSKPRRELIAELSGDLPPVSNPGKTLTRSLVWALVSATIAIAAIAFDGPFRSGSLQQLQHSPQFLFESVLGVVAIAALAIAAFRLGIPAATPVNKIVLLPLLLFAAWLAMYLLGLAVPALEPSMAGKRSHCFTESLLLGSPGLLLGVMAVRRLWPLNGLLVGGMLGLAAGAMPALVMQFACMYIPKHIILFHLLPGMTLGLVGVLLGTFFSANAKFKPGRRPGYHFSYFYRAFVHRFFADARICQ